MAGATYATPSRSLSLKSMSSDVPLYCRYVT